MDVEYKTSPRRRGIKELVRHLVSRVRVIALVGKSGTGKSFRAKLMAETYKVDYIIDDGLLIQGNSIVAGKSAKKEPTYMHAVRTALFDDPHHRNEVIKAISSRRIKRILILGTSIRMVTLVSERLDLPPPFEVLQIEEISTKSDMDKAKKSRDDQGEHVIPVPAIEVQRDYPNLISNSIKVFVKIGRGFSSKQRKKHKVYEKSIVQPTFNERDRGTIVISENAIAQMIAHCVDEFDETLLIRRVKIRKSRGAYQLRAEVKIPFANKSTENLQELKTYVMNRIEKFTGIMIGKFDLVIGGVSKPNWISEKFRTPEDQTELKSNPGD